MNVSIKQYPDKDKYPVLSLLETERIFSITLDGDAFRVREECDENFAEWLTCEKMDELIAELQLFVDSHRDSIKERPTARNSRQYITEN